VRLRKNTLVPVPPHGKIRSEVSPFPL